MKFTITLASSAVLVCALTAPVTFAQASKPAPKTSKQPASPQDIAPTAREQRQRAYALFLQGRQQESQGDFLGAIATYKEVIHLDPQAAAPHIALGELFYQNRNLRDAEVEARAAIALDKNEPGGHQLLGAIFLAQVRSGAADKNRIQDAINEYQEVARLDKNDPEAFGILGQLYLRLNDRDKALEAYQKLLGSGLAGIQEYDIVSRLLLEKGRYREAAVAARQAYAMSDRNPQVAANLAEALLRSGQSTEAVEVYQDVMTENGNNVGLLLGYVEALMRVGKYDEAIQGARKILEADAGNLDAISTLAQAYRRSGKRDEAIKILQQALKGQDVTESLKLQFELAEMQVELGRYDEGVASYETALKALLNPDGTVSDRNQRNASVILQRIVGVYRTARQRDKMFATFGRMRKVLGDKDTLADALEIDTLRDEGKYAEAAQAARKAQEKFPAERQFKYLEAYALSKLGETDKSVKLLQKLLGDSSEDADVFVNLATILMDANQLDEAEKMARRALQYEDKNVGYLVALSSIQDRRKQYKESEETLRRVLALDPDNATALNNLGYFLTERNERLDEARALVQRAVNIEPTNSSFLDSLGWVYFKQNQYETARQYLEQALGFDNRNPTLHDHMGDIQDKLGRNDLARKHWQTALDLATDREEIAKLKTKLKSPETGQK